MCSRKFAAVPTDVRKNTGLARQSEASKPEDTKAKHKIGSPRRLEGQGDQYLINCPAGCSSVSAIARADQHSDIHADGRGIFGAGSG